MAVGHQGPAGLGELVHCLCVVLHSLFQNLVLLQHGDSALLILYRQGTVTPTAAPIPKSKLPESRPADCTAGGREKDLAEGKKATSAIWAAESGEFQEWQGGLGCGSL